jgi:hypothetical protein
LCSPLLQKPKARPHYSRISRGILRGPGLGLPLSWGCHTALMVMRVVVHRHAGDACHPHFTCHPAIPIQHWRDLIPRRTVHELHLTLGHDHDAPRSISPCWPCGEGVARIPYLKLLEQHPFPRHRSLLVLHYYFNLELDEPICPTPFIPRHQSSHHGLLLIMLIPLRAAMLWSSPSPS